MGAARRGGRGRAPCSDGPLHSAGTRFFGGDWGMTTAEWLDIGWVDQIPVRGSRTVQVEGGDDIAVFRTAEGKVFALLDRCPHKHGRLSQGIVYGGAVACPLHNWRISLSTRD